MTVQLVSGAQPVVWGYGVATAIPLVLVGYAAVQRRQGLTAVVFAGTMLALALWAGAYVVRCSSTPLETKIAWQFVATIGIVLAPPGFLLFAAVYTERIRRVKPWYVLVLAVHPVATLVALATNPFHRLYYRGYDLLMVGTRPILETSPGPLFWVQASYSYAVLAIATLLLVGYALRYRSRYRLTMVSILVGALIPIGVNTAYLLGWLTVSGLDPTPVGFAVGSLVLAVGVFRGRLIDIAPVARDTVFDALDDAVVVLDPLDRIVDFNETARTLFDDEERPLTVGVDATACLPPSVIEAESDETIQIADSARWYRCRQVPIDDHHDGTAVILTDVTAIYRKQEHLRRQNERMTEFSSAAAHHLRNPLGVLTGYTELAEESGEERYFEGIREATSRMSRLVDDLVVLGREGRLVEDTEPVELERAVTDAWERVESADATLEREADLGRVAGNPERLTRLFEHAFRSALDRGGPAVTVRIDRLHYGFVVEDDGPGPGDGDDRLLSEHDDTVPGQNTFGLPVVRSIAEAHGWQINLVSDDDGFAIRITGVSRLADGVTELAGGIGVNTER